MRVAIIGANGQLGADLVKAFSGHEVIPWTRQDFDLCDGSRTASVIHRARPDAVVNTAAFHNTDFCEERPDVAFEVNAVAVRHLAQVCRSEGAALVHISTDYVFDGEKGAPYSEEDCPRPINVYGVSKAAGERFVAAICSQHYIIRVASLFGAAGSRGKHTNFIEKILSKAWEGQEVRVVTDVVMSPTFATDAAQVIRRILEANAPAGIYHVTNAGSCTWYAFAEAVFALCGLSERLRPWTIDEAAPKAARPRNSSLRSARLQQVGIAGLPAWRDALHRYLESRGVLARAGEPAERVGGA